MVYNHSDAVTIRTNGRENDIHALWALESVLEGKALCYERCAETLYHSMNPCEGIMLNLADDPDQACDTVVTFIPYIDDGGKARLKIDCHSVTDQDGAEDELAPVEGDCPADTMGDMMDETQLYDDDFPF